MNDLLKNSTKPKNIEELYQQILEIVTRLYEKCVPKNIKERKKRKS